MTPPPQKKFRPTKKNYAYIIFIKTSQLKKKVWTTFKKVLDRQKNVDPSPHKTEKNVHLLKKSLDRKKNLSKLIQKMVQLADTYYFVCSSYSAKPVGTG